MTDKTDVDKRLDEIEARAIAALKYVLKDSENALSKAEYRDQAKILWLISQVRELDARWKHWRQLNTDALNRLQECEHERDAARQGRPVSETQSGTRDTSGDNGTVPLDSGTDSPTIEPQFKEELEEWQQAGADGLHKVEAMLDDDKCPCDVCLVQWTTGDASCKDVGRCPVLESWKMGNASKALRLKQDCPVPPEAGVRHDDMSFEAVAGFKGKIADLKRKLLEQEKISAALGLRVQQGDLEMQVLRDQLADANALIGELRGALVELYERGAEVDCVDVAKAGVEQLLDRTPSDAGEKQRRLEAVAEAAKRLYDDPEIVDRDLEIALAALKPGEKET